jgi:antitoxin component YwqK of YwqJK toxin-antitoxin module
MKKILCLLFVTALFAQCSSVEVTENKDEAGRLIERFSVHKKTKLKDGLHETFYASGSKSEESHYVNGVLKGEQKFYYEAGQIQEIRNFDLSGSFSGAYKAYHSNGHLKSEGQYLNGAMGGKWKFFYPSGNIKEIVHFENNTENGPFIEYHENGKIKAEGTYADEREHGLLKLYDEKGELTKQMQCDNGACFTTWRSDMSKDSVKKL